MKFDSAHVCIVSSERVFFRKGNMICESELQFNCNHKDVPTILKIDVGLFKNCNLSLEYCYGSFQAIKYSIAN